MLKERSPCCLFTLKLYQEIGSSLPLPWYVSLGCCCSVTKLCLTSCSPTDCSTPVFPVHSVSLRVCSNSWPLSQWCHSAILSSIVPFSSCFQSFPASGSFLVNYLFTSGGQSFIGASASASVLPMNTQGWFPLGQTGLASLKSKVFSRVFCLSVILSKLLIKPKNLILCSPLLNLDRTLTPGLIGT